MIGREGMILKEQQAEAIANHAQTVLYSGAAGTIFFGFTVGELGIIIGSAIGIAGFLVNWYYKHKAYDLRKHLHDKLMNDEDE